MQFIRKREDPDGTYYAFVNGGRIKIEGRNIYQTQDEAEIEVLKNDPEIKIIKQAKPKNRAKNKK